MRDHAGAMLYRPEAFEPLTGDPWDAERVRAAIRRLVARIDDAFDPQLLWPAHDWDGWQAATPLKNLYVGAAGVLWALDRLREGGVAETRVDLAGAARATLDACRREPDFMRDTELPRAKGSALLTGETGILLVAWRLTGERALADELHARVVANVQNEAEEVMWGTPGTLVAARRMHEWTGDDRWRAAGQASAEALWARRDARGLWTQRLYGRTFQGLGTAHGLVGNVQALRPSLDDERRADLERDVNALLTELAVVEGDRANWPTTLLPEHGDDELRLQWCWGAPGIVAAAGEYLETELLEAGARLTWDAGAATEEKGFGICHGTAGNGYALLAAFERTGNEEWLSRARRFAVHALHQAESGPGRYSLWTGDPGAAVFAADCLAATGRYPILD
jgi:Lanthionine synthetase C-like protein